MGSFPMGMDIWIRFSHTGYLPFLFANSWRKHLGKKSKLSRKVLTIFKWISYKDHALPLQFVNGMGYEVIASPTAESGGVVAFSDPFTSLEFVSDFPLSIRVYGYHGLLCQHHRWH